MRKLLAALAFSAPLLASATVIDFEAIADGGSVSNQYAGVTFSSPGSSVEVGAYGQSSWGTGAPKIACPRNLNSYCGGTMVVDFASAVNSLSFYFTGDNRVGVDGSVAVWFGASLLGSVDLIGDGNGLTAHLIDLASFGDVTKLEISISQQEFSVAGLGYDDFSFNLANDVPEPGTLALACLGLLGLGYTTRRRVAV
ncbi:PEP-CTERM sorting domain-containing protein [Uliginosibacterium sp. H3]|uniref:PEP-CTERM sorting domain-containing protein n=1 Tax=Uliginosibacterium silvisoli TaxID=3114758 RepID=A0ABU6K8D5_9RHOO|nr:PEP-CTERM sorting domain-containing protein [Uliginosibacterium sp. H3]